MGTIKIVKGNLFAHNGKVFAHGVNCAGAMGAGIAVIFKSNFPEMYEDYRKECKEGRLLPGMAWSWCNRWDIDMSKDGRLTERANHMVYNLAIKGHWKLPASYKAVEASVNSMLTQMEENSENENLGYVIAMPWIGCGLGGLQQHVVKSILKRCLEGHDDRFEIWIYEL